MGSIRVQERTGNIDNLFSSPGKHQTRLLGYNSYFYCLQVFLFCIIQKLFYVLRIYDNCHTLLRLGDSDFCSVKSGIFLRYFVKIHSQTIRKLSDRYGNTARSEVITFLNEPADFFSAEHSLDLTLSRSISFLHLCAARLDGLFGVYLRGTGRSAASVPSGPSAKQDNDITRIGRLTDDCTSRSGA